MVPRCLTTGKSKIKDNIIYKKDNYCRFTIVIFLYLTCYILGYGLGIGMLFPLLLL